LQNNENTPAVMREIQVSKSFFFEDSQADFMIPGKFQIEV